MILEAIGRVFTGVMAPVNEWQKRKTLKVEKEYAARERAEDRKFALIEKGVEWRESYDLQALKEMRFSWKDEYWTFVLSLPFIGSFIPVIQDYVVNGWAYVDKAPEFYQWILIGVIASTFGLRWLFQRGTK